RRRRRGRARLLRQVVLLPLPLVLLPHLLLDVRGVVRRRPHVDRVRFRRRRRRRRRRHRSRWRPRCRFFRCRRRHVHRRRHARDRERAGRYYVQGGRRAYSAATATASASRGRRVEHHVRRRAHVDHPARLLLHHGRRHRRRGLRRF
ncbi:unnamed protein product, partial [Ectocarpus sp. 12 AP-2014]